MNFTELTLCSTTDFSNGQRMYDYARFSGDWAGVEQQGAANSTVYYAKCPDGKWWHAPKCRGNAPNCIPVFTAGNGWKLQAMMQWTAAYDFPAAIAIPGGWSTFVKHVQTYKCLHYWWIPDSTFIDMQPEQLVFPRHSANEWLAGDKKTGGQGSYVSKMVSRDLEGKARRVQDFVSNLVFELPEVSDLLLEVKQTGSIYNVSCGWIRSNRARWRHGSPSKPTATRDLELLMLLASTFQPERVLWDVACAQPALSLRSFRMVLAGPSNARSAHQDTAKATLSRPNASLVHRAAPPTRLGALSAMFASMAPTNP